MTGFQRGKALFFGASILALVAGGAAHAQTADAQEAAELETVVVTGSRLTAGFSAPTPVTVIGQEQIESRAPTSVFDVTRDIPSFRASSGLSNGGVYGIQNAGAATLDLRGLGSSRTLVLIDGRRPVPTNDDGSFDTNTIPSTLIERTDVVTGGASAAYGSDAVAGVVNFVLDTDFEGLKGNVQYGVTQRGDGEEKNIGLAYGRQFMDGRVRFVIGGEMADNNGIGQFWKERDWGAKSPGLVTLGANRPAGVPQNVILEDVELSGHTSGGLITSGPLAGIAFGADSQPFNYRYGPLVGALTQYIPGTPNGEIYYYNMEILPKYERSAALANIEFDVTEDITAFARVSYGAMHTHATTIEFPQPARFTVLANNPYLPESVRQQMAARGVNSFVLNRAGRDVGPLRAANRTETWRFDTGLNGRLPISGNWQWDLGYSYGKGHITSQLLNTPRTADLYAAAYAVPGPNGAPVCGPIATNPMFNAQTADVRALWIANLSPGCVPYDIIGPNGNEEAINYFNSFSGRGTDIKQNNAVANITGEPLSLPAGAVSLAAGLEWRKISMNQVGNRDAQRGALSNQNYPTYAADITVKEAYGEIGIPVLKDMPLALSLDLNGAIRRTHYSTSGSVTTWKAGFTYEPTDFLRLRFTQSHDIRAPNAQELFTPGSTGGSGGTVLTNRLTGASSFTKGNTFGNPNLTPEIGDTTTMGLVFQPSFIPGLRASVDYFHIIIHDQIGSIGGQEVLDRLLLGKETQFAPFVQFDASQPNGVFLVAATQLNLAGQKQHGFDFELAYNFPFQDWGLPGNLQFRTLATHYQSLRQIQGITDREQLGVLVPKWQANSTLNYTLDRFTTSLTARYQSQYKYSATLIGPDDPAYNPAANSSINKNWWGSSLLFNFYAAYDIVAAEGRRLQLFGGIDNLLDKDPSMVAVVTQNGANGYDLRGRRFKLGMRFQY